MDNTIISFILTLLAGLSTLFGMVIIFIFKKTNYKVISFSLSFAAGVMVSISFTDLIPESIEMLKSKLQNFPLFLIVLILITIGILLSIFIDKLFPSANNTQSRLYQVGLISMIAIIIHNIPEGIITFLSANTKLSLGLSIAIAIALHNIPEGMSIAVPIYYSTKNKKLTFSYTFLSAISEPFGAVLAYLFLKSYINNTILGILFAITAGIMLHISFYELLPTSMSYNNKKITYVAFLFGFLFMYFTRNLLSI